VSDLQVAQPATAVERDLVVACLVSDQPAPYNVPVFLRFGEPVDAGRLRDAAASVLAGVGLLRRRYLRHGREILRETGTGLPEVERLACTRDELAGVTAHRRLGVLDRHLVRAAVIEVDGEPYPRLFVNVHHVLMDGLSLALFLHAVVECYLTGRAPQLESDQPDLQPPEPPDLPDLPDLAGPAAVADFQRAFTARCGTGAGSGLAVHRRTIELPGGNLSFAANLAAFAPALAEWVGMPQVVLSVALLGRPVTRLRTLGNFVRLQPLALDAGGWSQLPPAEVLGMTRRLARELLLRSTLPAQPAARAGSRLSDLLVVLDHKTEALVPEQIHPRLKAFVEDDPSYLDHKFGLHFNIDATPRGLRLTVSAQGVPEPALVALTQNHERHLRRIQGGPASTPVPAVRYGGPPR
jgi:hypothetical protein